AQVVVHGEGGVAGGVDAAGDGRVDLAERDLVGRVHDRLQAGAAGHLDVGGGRGRRELAAQHDLTGQVEVARVLQHGTGGDLTELLALQRVPAHQAVHGCGEHVLVGGVGVGAVRPRERDAVRSDDR